MYLRAGHQPLPLEAPYAQPSPLTAPRAQPPPSQIPTERLASTADDWTRGSTASPAPPPAVTALHNDFGVPSYAPMQPPPPPSMPYGGYGPPVGSPAPAAYPAQPGAQMYTSAPSAGGMHAARAASYAYGAGPAQPTPQSYGPPMGGHSRPASYAQPPQSIPPGSVYGAAAPAAAYYSPQQQPPPQAYAPPPPNMGQPPQPPPPQGMYLAPAPTPPPGTLDPNGHVSRPARVASMQPNDFAALQNGMESMRLGASSPAPSNSSGGVSRPNYYANPEDGPPYKLSVNPPDVSRDSRRTRELP